MEDLSKHGTPEQQMLLTLASKVDDVHKRMQQELDDLHSEVKSLLERVPDPGCTSSLAEMGPPPDETAEEEAHRIARKISGKIFWYHEDRTGGFNRQAWVGRMRHECNKALLRSNGFHVREAGDDIHEEGVYLEWNRRDEISPASQG